MDERYANKSGESGIHRAHSKRAESQKYPGKVQGSL